MDYLTPICTDDTDFETGNINYRFFDWVIFKRAYGGT